MLSQIDLATRLHLFDRMSLVSTVQIVEFGFLLLLEKYAVGRLVEVFFAKFGRFTRFLVVFVLENRF